MKKLVTGGLILALALTGAPQAVAFSSGSSSPNVVQPVPDPSPIYSVDEVLQLLTTAYNVHFLNRGYTFNQDASHLAKMYHEGTAEDKARIRERVAEIGFDVRVETFPTNTYKEKYQELVNTPISPKNSKLVGGYIEVDYYTTVATFVIAR